MLNRQGAYTLQLENWTPAPLEAGLRYAYEMKAAFDREHIPELQRLALAYEAGLMFTKSKGAA